MACACVVVGVFFELGNVSLVSMCNANAGPTATGKSDLCKPIAAVDNPGTSQLLHYIQQCIYRGIKYVQYIINQIV